MRRFMSKGNKLEVEGARYFFETKMSSKGEMFSKLQPPATPSQKRSELSFLAREENQTFFDLRKQGHVEKGNIILRAR